MKLKKIIDEEVNIKLSSCLKCNGVVTASVEHMMDSKMKKEFYNEAKKYNLNISTMKLLDYRENNPKWCECETKQITK